jgi:hypothetical protein
MSTHTDHGKESARFALRICRQELGEIGSYGTHLSSFGIPPKHHPSTTPPSEEGRTTLGIAGLHLEIRTCISLGPNWPNLPVGLAGP